MEQIFDTQQIGNITIVIANVQQNRRIYPKANYNNTRMAVVGTLKPGQTLENFIKKFKYQKMKLEAIK